MSEGPDPYEVLAEYFDYYEVMGAVFHFEFDEIADKSFQLGTQVTWDQVRRRSDGTVKVTLNAGDEERPTQKVSFYRHGGVRWDRGRAKAHSPGGYRVVAPEDVRVVVHA